MLHEVVVDGKAVVVLVQVDPFRLDVDGPVPLLQEEDVGYHVCPGIGAKGIVGESNRAQQVGPLRQILSHRRVFRVHGVAAGHKGHHAAGTHLVQRLGEKVVVNGKTELVVSPVIHLVLAEGDVSYGQVEKVAAVRGFKACHGNVGLGVELLCDSARYAVQLHPIEAAGAHFLREHPEEVAHAHRRLQNVAGPESHVSHGLIDGADHGGAGVVGVEGAAAGGGVFRVRQQSFQL